MAHHKYRAVATVVDGIKFASKKEAKRYSELLLLLAAQYITAIELQPVFKLGTDDNPVIYRPSNRRAKYIADFRYKDLVTGKTVVEDVKGMDTRLSALKRAIVEAQYGIKIVLI